ncbi:GNAT family N-acetyltransferase [Lachnospira multipara]|uniref:Ribosomal protein S18 acetylase RimI n=1 Tax=Lachnospira multipara TaxID=28051 RepID=A0A1H5UYJ7_9FIRM|nr:GNAT family N-acetyltransferase [Lachnospira multipara]SEF80083.1 Ribosomal protein S18 acetylase RimI [Lachnospira multipara]
MKEFEFRTIRLDEIDQAVEIEQICFPPNEACTREAMTRRINKAKDDFFVAIDKETGLIAGFVNGLATKEITFRDEFFTQEELYDVNGDNIMILGLDVLPEYRMQGLARSIISKYGELQFERGRKYLTLTCLDSRVPMYKKFGFEDLGQANSTWGGEAWHEMRKSL